MTDQRAQEAIALMARFAQRTGITSGRSPRRYLWTDAFAVCNFLGLGRDTGDHRYTALALRLIAQVHHTLGRHRSDDARAGWVSGLDEHEAEAHPTWGGLRIGKALPEREPDAAIDENLEWERDGQYFHYLTKWMHALDQASRFTGQAHLNAWARELAAAAFDAFTYVTGAGRPRRMVWKMSIDLLRALVPSMGHHDPLDGYVTSRQLGSSATSQSHAPSEPALEKETRAFAAMLEGQEWATPDPLGIGGLLFDAYRIAQLIPDGRDSDECLLAELLAATLAGLQHYARSGQLNAPAEYRLAFRELGLAIGLHAVPRISDTAAQEGTAKITEIRSSLEALMTYRSLGEAIEAFWRDPAHREIGTWAEHQDINEVMLATSLVPDGFLVLASAD